MLGLRSFQEGNIANTFLGMLNARSWSIRMEG
jgi:hypothetical protein